MSCVFVFAAVGLLPGWAQEKPKSDAAPVFASFYSALTGKWTGELEYRDYTSNERVKLPTWLDVVNAADGRSLELRYTYDDGPKKVIQEISHLTIDAEGKSLTMASGDGKDESRYTLSGLDKLTPAGLGTLELTGSGTENDQKVDVRITLKAGRNYYRYVKETRLPGKEFEFRDAYNFTRREPPPLTH